MKRSVTLTLGNNDYTFLTSDSQEQVEQVFEIIQKHFAELEKGIETIGLEKSFIFMLLNITNDLVKTQNELLRLKDKYENILGDYYKGRGKVEKP